MSFSRLSEHKVPSAPQTNPLHLALANRVIEYARTQRLPAGHHLTEQSLEQVLGASRSPIRGALAFLAEQGLVETRPPKRGLFLAYDGSELAALEETLPTSDEDQAYLALARDRLDGCLPDVLSEIEAMRRYNLTRERMRRVLTRAANEGWIEQRTSKGWAFLPMIDGPQSCAQSYDLRIVLEPSALQMESFELDLTLLDRMRAEQQELVDGGYETATHAQMVQANANFHEGLARLSGNRFVEQTVMRHNQLRSLLEYRETAADRDRVRRQCVEHLAILDCLASGDRVAAAALLKQHLEKARAGKIAQLSKAARERALASHGQQAHTKNQRNGTNADIGVCE
ncbi:FCD domain-containing protein [Orrella sp. 11846]|uniref:GntR family transcriptional regulator n=1 Tax=Orrella sp. 11846 TaxID=3409913 RepID=UPI003B597FA5